MWVKIPKDMIVKEDSVLLNIKDSHRIRYDSYGASSYIIFDVDRQELRYRVESQEAYEKLLDYILEQCNNNRNRLK